MTAGAGYRGPFSRKIERGMRFISDHKMMFHYTVTVFNLADRFMKENLAGSCLETYRTNVFPYLDAGVKDIRRRDYESALGRMMEIEEFARQIVPERLGSVGDGGFIFSFMPVEEFPRELAEHMDPLLAVEGPDGKKFILYSSEMDPELDTHEDNLPYDSGPGNG